MDSLLRFVAFFLKLKITSNRYFPFNENSKMYTLVFVPIGRWCPAGRCCSWFRQRHRLHQRRSQAQICQYQSPWCEWLNCLAIWTKQCTCIFKQSIKNGCIHFVSWKKKKPLEHNQRSCQIVTISKSMRTFPPTTISMVNSTYFRYVKDAFYFGQWLIGFQN